MRASVVAACGLSSCGPQALEHRLHSCGAQASLPHSMGDAPGSGIEPVFPALTGRLFTTGPPWKPRDHLLEEDNPSPCSIFILEIIGVTMLSKPWNVSHRTKEQARKEVDWLLCPQHSVQSLAQGRFWKRWLWTKRILINPESVCEQLKWWDQIAPANTAFLLFDVL